MSNQATLPLFVLPMVLMPGEVQELRVFEPRYRQMLDDCVLDNKNFGLVMNDPFEPANHWDGPRSHGCEAEILEHDTKGSNHFLSIIGRRRFIVEEVIAPALPPFEHPSMEALNEDDGLYPDLQTLLSHVPESSTHEKLYIAANVRYYEDEAPTSDEHQTMLREILDGVLKRIGAILRIDDTTLDSWVAERVDHVIDEKPTSVFTVAALVLNGLEAKQQVLASADAEEALAELNHQLSSFYEEE
ncbi:MAG: LON peptidase substrate-binding domain-containing protein [Candidatus Poseidoniaceae archaeon]|nr:LON peptidase substrate-binding domain-containing protein [Candidatus Poseidoniaceae archaeon]